MECGIAEGTIEYTYFGNGRADALRSFEADRENLARSDYHMLSMRWEDPDPNVIESTYQDGGHVSRLIVTYGRGSDVCRREMPDGPSESTDGPR